MMPCWVEALDFQLLPALLPPLSVYPLPHRDVGVLFSFDAFLPQVATIDAPVGLLSASSHKAYFPSPAPSKT